MFVLDMVDSLTDNSPADWDIGYVFLTMPCSKLDSFADRLCSAYPNYADGRLKNWQQLYFGSHYHRLQILKREFDPRNTFSFPQSIEL